MHCECTYSSWPCPDPPLTLSTLTVHLTVRVFESDPRLSDTDSSFSVVKRVTTLLNTVEGGCAVLPVSFVVFGRKYFILQYTQLIQGGRTAAHLIMVATAKPRRKRAAEPAGRKHVWLGVDDVTPSLFRERLFRKDGRVCLRIHRGMGIGFWLSKTRADGMLAGGRKQFVALLTRCRPRVVRHYGGALEDQPAHKNCASDGRPMFTKDEHTKVQAAKDAGAMATASAKVAKALQQQRSAKDIQTAKGWFPCLQLDPTESCYCECSFQRAHGLAQHIERHTCRFPRAPGGTAAGCRSYTVT